MEITLRIDWASMIEGTTKEALESIDQEATMKAYARQATSIVEREYPGADIDVRVVLNAPSMSTLIEPYDAEVASDLDDILEQVWNGQGFWVGKKMYMNPETGSVDDHDGWWYEDENGHEVNAVDRGEVTEVVRNANGDWVDAAAARLGRRGGKTRTDKTATASRENGKKGGRPRKATAE